MDHQHSQTRRQRADAIVEFALLAPMLVLVLFGILELGRLVDAWGIVHNAAREGARAGVVNHPLPDAAGAARSATTNYLQFVASTRSDVATISVPAPVVTTDAVEVTAQMDVQIFTPLIQTLISSPVPVRATVRMPR